MKYPALSNEFLESAIKDSLATVSEMRAKADAPRCRKRELWLSTAQQHEEIAADLQGELEKRK